MTATYLLNATVAAFNFILTRLLDGNVLNLDCLVPSLLIFLLAHWFFSDLSSACTFVFGCYVLSRRVSYSG